MQTAIFLQLPLLSTLKGFGFNNEDGCCITAHIEQLVKLMQPTKTDEQLLSINDISKEVYTIVEKYLLTEARFAPIIKTPEALALCVSNLTGLLIQSFDAGRGLLSNTLLHFLCNEQFPRDNHYLQKSVVETLRFDSPIHNTRRVATEDIIVDNHKIEKGQFILIVLAAANRDKQQFKNPHSYNIERSNNSALLTLGIGAHACLAKHLSINMAAADLQFLFTRYNTIHLLQRKIEYEPLVNARLPKRMSISLR